METSYKRAFLTDKDPQLQPWKHAISQGNQAFMRGDTQRARASYEMALYTVKRVLMESLEMTTQSRSMDYLDNVMAALIVTQHNIADLLARDGALCRAVEHLCEAHEAMFIMRFHAIPDIRTMAGRHLQLTHSELVSFTNRHGAHEQINNTFLITKPVCRSCARLSLH